MATTGGIDRLQRDIVGNNHTMTDMGPIIAQRGDIVSVGNGSSATGDQSVCVGYNANDGGQAHTTILGPANTVSSEEGVVVGYNNVVPSDHCVVVGANIIVGSGEDRCTSVGSLLASYGQFILNVGVLNTIGTIANSSENVFAFGLRLLAGEGWTDVLLMGSNIDLSAQNVYQDSVIIGKDISGTANNLYRAVAVGTNITLADSERAVAIGDFIAGVADDSVLIGSSIVNSVSSGRNSVVLGSTIANSARRNVVMGSGTSAGVDTAESVVIGYSVVLNTTSPNSAVVASSTTVGNGCPNIVILGSGWTVPTLSTNAILIGSGNDTNTCAYSVIIGNNIDLNDGNGSHIIIAANNGGGAVSLVGLGASKAKMIASDGCSIGDYCERAILIGEESTIGLGSTIGSADVVVIGNQNSAPDDSSEVTIVGYSIDLLNANSAHNTLLGDIISVGGGGISKNEFCSILGNNITIAHGNDEMVVLGYDIQNDTASHSSVYIGATMTIGTASPNVVAIGSDLILAAASPRTTLIGYSNVLAGGSNNTVYIASSSTTTGPLVRSSLIGTQVSWNAGSDNSIIGSLITMPVQCDNSIVVGSNIIYGAGGPARTTEIAICASPTGTPTTVGLSSVNLILIGSGDFDIGANSSNCVIIGQGAQIAIAGALGSPEVVAVGNLIVIGDGSDGATIVGSQAGAVAGAIWSTVIGFNAHANGQAGIAIGAGAVAPSRYCVIGNSNDDYYLTNLQVMGDDAAPFFEVYGNIPLARVGIDVGMKVWDGATLSQVSSEIAPPVGARLLYIL